MLTDAQQRNAAKKFAAEWENRGYEKGETQIFWTSLLRNVFGVEQPESFIVFEKQVTFEGHTLFIDAEIPETRIMIEQKSKDVALNKPARQSNGAMLTPYQQAKRYSDELELSKKPRYIVVCNFQEFHIHDMEHPHNEPEILKLADLPKDYHRLNFLTDTHKARIAREKDLSIDAGKIVGQIYDAIQKHYNDPAAESTLKSLNMLCVRLVFCLYAEDAGILGAKNLFSDYLTRFEARDIRRALIDLFKVLDTPQDKRKSLYLDDDLAAFPYVNGGLFAETDIEIPQFDNEIKELLLGEASRFDWREISPTIFGAVFESTLNPETRRSGGMHYTSIENIHKVIDPLFLDDLKAELEEILSLKAVTTRNKKLFAFQDKIASLNFLDPACGSGNFLTETYLSLRKLENECIKTINEGQTALGFDDVIKVSIGQFYGIEINDFAVTVAKTALWIAESQMMKATKDIVDLDLEFLPLKSYANIIEANALRIDWNDVVPKEKLNYIMGNPPFVGYSLQSAEQKADMLNIYVDEKGKPYKTAGKIDYVAAWYFKSAEMMQGNAIRTALVSTNSITQGEQVAGVWKPLYERFGVHIDFAHRTFRWDSEANIKAHVHCVIIGFSTADNARPKRIFNTDENGNVRINTENCSSIRTNPYKSVPVRNINAYLTDAPDVFIESRNKPLCDVPEMVYGSKPTDGGFLFLTQEEKNTAIEREPFIEKYIHRFVGADEFINNKLRFCLWLNGVSPAEINKSNFIKNRIKNVYDFRMASSKKATRNSALHASLFQEIRQSLTSYIIVPAHTGGSRLYIPMGFEPADVICGNANLSIPDATLFHFGFLVSSVHMAWMRFTCGYLGTSYRYSASIVYNNFPWPSSDRSDWSDLSDKISKTAQAILDARALHPDCSLAALYDETTMPLELRKAHQANDKAVMKAYGYAPSMTEPEIVADLMKRYQELTAKDK
ncbi:MAG: class I SAM-dependent DNA methyltransferase [Lentisphaerae bacterium]|nr:class I SAM-dependent DNA methyltransferase [Lentisphaerota bacterium]